MKSYLFAGTTMTVLVGGDETDGKFAVLHVIKPPGSSTPPHSHDNETEVSYVLSGSVRVQTEGRITDVREGELCVLPPKRPHRLFNDSTATAREFLLCSPAVFDRFVAEAGTPTEIFGEPKAMTASDRERLVELAPRYGIRLLRSAEPPDSPQSQAKSEHKTWDVLGTHVEFIGQIGQREDDLALLRMVVPPGGTVALPSHPDPKCFFVIDGRLEIYRSDLATGWSALNVDHAMYVAGNVEHAIRNASDLPGRALLVTTLRMAELLQTVNPPGSLS